MNINQLIKDETMKRNQLVKEKEKELEYTKENAIHYVDNAFLYSIKQAIQKNDKYILLGYAITLRDATGTAKLVIEVLKERGLDSRIECIHGKLLFNVEDK